MSDFVVRIPLEAITTNVYFDFNKFEQGDYNVYVDYVSDSTDTSIESVSASVILSNIFNREHRCLPDNTISLPILCTTFINETNQNTNMSRMGNAMKYIPYLPQGGYFQFSYGSIDDGITSIYEDATNFKPGMVSMRFIRNK